MLVFRATRLALHQTIGGRVPRLQRCAVPSSSRALGTGNGDGNPVRPSAPPSLRPRLTFVQRRERAAARRRTSVTRQPTAAMVDPDAATNKYVGFGRKEMGSEALTATVKHFDCHSFFVHNTAETWPSLEFGGGDAATAMDEALKAAASGAFKGGVFQFQPGASKVGKVKLNLCEDGARGHAGDAPGDVLMFPQMRRHRLGPAASPAAVASFVDGAVVQGDGQGRTLVPVFSLTRAVSSLTPLTLSFQGTQVKLTRERWCGPGDGTTSGELLTGAHVFVCTHAARDARCGLCGPALIDAFRKEISDAGLEHLVAVRGCSHTGGHKYAGNVLVFVPENGVGGDLVAREAGQGGWSAAREGMDHSEPPFLELNGVL